MITLLGSSEKNPSTWNGTISHDVYPTCMCWIGCTHPGYTLMQYHSVCGLHHDRSSASKYNGQFDEQFKRSNLFYSFGPNRAWPVDF